MNTKKAFMKKVIFIIASITTMVFSQIDTNNIVRNFQIDETPIPNFITELASKMADSSARHFCEIEFKGSPTSVDPKLSLKFIRHYKQGSTKIFSFGFVFKADSMNLEDNSAHSFIFGTYSNNRITFITELENYIGEIKMKLYGYNTKKETRILYGEAFPYFGNTRGKFKLEINPNDTKYYWEYNNKSQ